MQWFRTLLVGVSMVGLAGPVSAQSHFDDIPKGDRSLRTGPEVGERVPAFSLPDQTGRMRDLRSIAGPNGAIILFYRSADW